jgi:hypothetical protein
MTQGFDCLALDRDSHKWPHQRSTDHLINIIYIKVALEPMCHSAGEEGFMYP